MSPAPLALGFASQHLGLAAAPLAEWCALAGGVLAAVLVGSDLVPRDVERRAPCGVGLASRLPGALAASFVGKVLLFTAALAVCSALGFASGRITDLARAIEVDSSAYDVDLLGVALVAGAAAPWIFAASTLVVRAIWSVPLGLVAGSGVYGVAALGGVLTDSAVVSALFLALNASAALVVAWFGFVRGHANGPAPRRAAVLGGAALAVLTVPTIAFGGSAAWSELSIDPNADGFRIQSIVLVEGGERILVQATQQRRHPSAPGELFDPWFEQYRAFEIDLATGAWTPLWERNTAFDAPSPRVGDPPYRYVTVHSIADGRGSEGRVWDARERRFVGDDALDAVIEATVEASGADDWRRLGRGTYESRDVPRDERVVLDPATGHRVAMKELASDDGARPVCALVRDGRWVLSFHRFDEATRRREDSIELYDPATGERERVDDVARLLRSSLGFGRSLPDGRLLGREGSSIVVFDPESPATAIEIRGFTFEHEEHSSLLTLDRRIGSPSAGHLFLLIHDGLGRCCVGRLQLDTLELDVVELEERSSVWNATVIEADRLLLQTRRDTLVLVDLDAWTVRTVFSAAR